MPITFLIDEDVPVAIADFLKQRGHIVELAVDVVGGQGAPDHVIAGIANEIGGVVVTWNRSHFKRFINRSETKGSQKLRKAGLITFYRLPEPMGLSRIKQAIDLIEAEANHVAKNKDTRLILVISKDWFRFER